MSYYNVKNRIKKEILFKYGTIKAFVEKNPGKGFNQVKISQWLNPSQNITLETLYVLTESLGLDVIVVEKTN